MPATPPARGPAAFTTQSASMWRPSARRTPVARPPLRSTSTTSPVTSSTPSERALRAERLEQGVGVEPALIGQAERAAGQVVDLHPRESGLQLGRRQERDVHAVLALDGVVALEDRDPRLARQEEVAALHEVDLGRGLPLDAEPRVRVPDHLDPEAADLDVERGAELEADRRGREGRRRGAEGEVALDDHDPAVPVGASRQEGRRGAADDGAADDHHVGAVGVAHTPMLARATLRGGPRAPGRAAGIVDSTLHGHQADHPRRRRRPPRPARGRARPAREVRRAVPDRGRQLGRRGARHGPPAHPARQHDRPLHGRPAHAADDRDRVPGAGGRAPARCAARPADRLCRYRRGDPRHQRDPPRPLHPQAVGPARREALPDPRRPPLRLERAPSGPPSRGCGCSPAAGLPAGT